MTDGHGRHARKSEECGHRLQEMVRFTMQAPAPHRIFRWKHEMDSDTVARFEGEAGDLLEELGYARATRA